MMRMIHRKHQQNIGQASQWEEQEISQQRCPEQNQDPEKAIGKMKNQKARGWGERGTNDQRGQQEMNAPIAKKNAANEICDVEKEVDNGRKVHCWEERGKNCSQSALEEKQRDQQGQAATAKCGKAEDCKKELEDGQHLRMRGHEKTDLKPDRRNQ